jgi:hypothetical protein
MKQRPPSLYFVTAAQARDLQRCRGCAAEVVWIQTPAGKNMPLSWKSRTPVAADHLVKNAAGEAQDLGDGWNMISHWADCPEAERFRRAARATRENRPR